MEIWKGVIYQNQDLSWRFEVSNLGNIRNTKTKHIYKPHPGGIGYLQICTTINGKRYNIKIHKAVAETFLENKENKKCVNHKDGSKLNNNLENLEWMTHQENSQHAFKNGLLKPHNNYNNNNNNNRIVRSGELNNLSKLTNEDIFYIRENYIPKQKGKKCNRKELAEKFNVTPNLIYKIYKKEIWKHI